MKSVRIFSFGIAALALTAATASANLTPIFITDTLITSGNELTENGLDSSVTVAMEGDYLYSYTINLDATQQIAPGQSALCLDELTGLIASSASVTASNWSATQGGSGGCQSATPVALNAGTAVGQNTGAWVEVAYNAPGGIVSGPTSLGTFYFVTSDATVGTNNDAYGGTAQANGTTSASQGTITANQGEVSGPQSTIPEPGTLALIGLGLTGVGLVRRRSAREVSRLSSD